MDMRPKMEKILRDKEFDRSFTKEEAIAYSRSLDESRMKMLYEVAHEAKKKDYFLYRDFYLVLIITNGPPPDNLPLDIPIARRSCPTPAYNQNVWKYHWQSDSLEYLWTIPKAVPAKHLFKYQQHYLSLPKWRKLTSFVCLFETGQLLDWVKKENGELEDGLITINSPITA